MVRVGRWGWREWGGCRCSWGGQVAVAMSFEEGGEERVCAVCVAVVVMKGQAYPLLAALAGSVDSGGVRSLSFPSPQPASSLTRNSRSEFPIANNFFHSKPLSFSRCAQASHSTTYCTEMQPSFYAKRSSWWVF